MQIWILRLFRHSLFFDRQSKLLFKHGFSVGINQKPAFYAKECQFRRVNGLNSPRIVLLIVDSPFEIEKVFIAF